SPRRGARGARGRGAPPPPAPARERVRRRGGARRPSRPPPLLQQLPRARHPPGGEGGRVRRDRALGLRRRRLAAHLRAPRAACRGRGEAGGVQGHGGGAPLPLRLPGERGRDHGARRPRRPRLQRCPQPREHRRRVPALSGQRPRLSPPRRAGPGGRARRHPTRRPPAHRERLGLFHGRRPGTAPGAGRAGGRAGAARGARAQRRHAARGPPRPRARRARRHAHRAGPGGRQPRRARPRRRAARTRRARARDPAAHGAAGHGAAARHTHGHAHDGPARARARGLRRRGARDGPRRMTDPATLAAWDQRYLWHPFTQMADWLTEEPLVIAEAEGCTLVDTRGRRYLDGVSSLWCNVHGHRHPALDAALRDQLARLAHSTLLGLANVPSIELARALIEIAPRGLTRVFYSDAGATAVEAALRLALQYHQLRGEPARTRFASLVEAYHGDTLGAVGVGYSETFHRFVAGAVAPAVRLTPPHVFRWQRGLDAEAALAAALAEAERTLAAHGPTLAAVVVEPLVQGAAGMWVHPPAYLRALH